MPNAASRGSRRCVLGSLVLGPGAEAEGPRSCSARHRNPLPRHSVHEGWRRFSSTWWFFDLHFRHLVSPLILHWLRMVPDMRNDLSIRMYVCCTLCIGHMFLRIPFAMPQSFCPVGPAVNHSTGLPSLSALVLSDRCCHYVPIAAIIVANKETW